MSALFPSRVRFNWGYHDAGFSGGRNTPSGEIRNDQWAQNHFDKSYGAGFSAGLIDKANGATLETSDRAWGEYKGRNAQ